VLWGCFRLELIEKGQLLNYEADDKGSVGEGQGMFGEGSCLTLSDGVIETQA